MVSFDTFIMAYSRRWFSFLSSNPSRSKNRAFDSLCAKGARCGGMFVPIEVAFLESDVPVYCEGVQKREKKWRFGCQPKGAAMEASFRIKPRVPVNRASNVDLRTSGINFNR